MTDTPQIILPHGGYRKLIVYQKSDTIYEGTVVFCKRFLPAWGDRTVDQMKQAARSCKQNIAEGSSASGTSKETELKLTNVARASLDELLEDYLDYLKTHGLKEWEANSPEKILTRQYSREHDNWEDWKNIISTNNVETVCNSMIVIIQQTRYLLERMIMRMDVDFRKYGGVRERMYNARVDSREEEWNKVVFNHLSSSLTMAELQQRVSAIMHSVTDMEQRISKRMGWSDPRDQRDQRD